MSLAPHIRLFSHIFFRMPQPLHGTTLHGGICQIFMKSIFFERCNNVQISEHIDVQSGESAVNDHTACSAQQINAVNDADVRDKFCKALVL